MFEYLVNIPSKILFGKGKRSELGSEAAAFGKRIFLLYDPYLKGSALIEDIKDDMASKAIAVTEFSNVSPNPRNTVIDEAVALCLKKSCDAVVAIGGGSAIDSGKAVAIVSANGGKTWDYTERENEYVARPKKAKLPLIAVPTTSGTGTEATPYAVINNLEKHFKGTIINEMCFPTISVVDPEIMQTMPPMLTALTGIDAFSHCFESYINKNATPFSEIIALEGMRLFVENIRECVKNGSNTEARGKMALASMLGGLSIAHAPTTMPHAIGQPLSGMTDAPHGGSIAACIAAVIEWTLPYGEKKIARVTELFDPSAAKLPDREKAAMLPNILTSLFREIMGGKLVTMGGYGLKEEQISPLADMVLKCYAMDCSCHPKTPTKDDLMLVIKKSM